MSRQIAGATQLDHQTVSAALTDRAEGALVLQLLRALLDAPTDELLKPMSVLDGARSALTRHIGELRDSLPPNPSASSFASMLPEALRPALFRHTLAYANEQLSQREFGTGGGDDFVRFETAPWLETAARIGLPPPQRLYEEALSYNSWTGLLTSEGSAIQEEVAEQLLGGLVTGAGQPARVVELLEAWVIRALRTAHWFRSQARPAVSQLQAEASSLLGMLPSPVPELPWSPGAAEAFFPRLADALEASGVEHRQQMSPFVRSFGSRARRTFFEVLLKDQQISIRLDELSIEVDRVLQARNPFSWIPGAARVHTAILDLGEPGPYEHLLPVLTGFRSIAFEVVTQGSRRRQMATVSDVRAWSAAEAAWLAERTLSGAFETIAFASGGPLPRPEVRWIRVESGDCALEMGSRHARSLPPGLLFPSIPSFVEFWESLDPEAHEIDARLREALGALAEGDRAEDHRLALLAYWSVLELLCPHPDDRPAHARKDPNCGPARWSEPDCIAHLVLGGEKGGSPVEAAACADRLKAQIEELRPLRNRVAVHRSSQPRANHAVIEDAAERLRTLVRRVVQAAIKLRRTEGPGGWECLWKSSPSVPERSGG